MNIEESLRSIGFIDREIKIYLALLELGDSTVLPIATKAEIKRPYAYDILEDLQKKGIVTHIEKNGRRRYIAENPDKITGMLQDRMQTFLAALPELKSIYNYAPNKPKVRFYEGIDEVKQIYEQLVHVKAYDCIYSPDFLLPIWGQYSNDLGRRVAQNGVEAREILASTIKPVGYEKYYKKPLQQIKYLPESVKLSTDIVLYENKLALVSYDHNIHTVVIEGSGIVSTHKTMFDLLWSSIK